MTPPVVSADEHIVEPPEFWSEILPASLPPRFRDRAPVLRGPALVVDGAVAPAFDLFPDLVERSDAAPGASDVAGRLAVMDELGVDVAVLYQQRAMAMFAFADHELLEACFDAYNTWLAELCDSSDGRLAGIAILPCAARPDAAADHLARVRELGLVAVMLPGRARGISYADPALDPLWSAIEESGLPLTFHVSESPDDNGPGGLGTYLTTTFQPFRKLWAHLVFSGVLERHPGLRVVFAEGGISWIPSALDHADRIHETFAGHLEPALPRPPSHYWHRQCYATFMEDPMGIEQIAHIGADRVLWSSDYPHPEGTHGRTGAVLAELGEQLGPDVAAAVIGGTAAAVYGLGAEHPR